VLGTFKYANFLVENLNWILVHFHWQPCTVDPIHLPLGISFYTFHALSYVLDVYRREVPAMKNPINFALYISFFPQSIAGPIVRYNDVAAQLSRRVVTGPGFAEGVRRFIIGLAKKMIVANTLAVPADAIFALPASELTASLAWLGIVCYTLQIYFDFSGYSDMAIALAKFFGFQFRENFHFPYTASSITDFWRRWHISLSTWYRDYLYVPLGGNRRGTARLYFNLVTVFCLCGLWHGASWTFIFWGLFHGTFLVVERMVLGKVLAGAGRPIRHVYTLLVIILGWVFFKSATFSQALEFLGAMAGFGAGTGWKFHPGLYLNLETLVILMAGMVGCMPFWPWLARLRNHWLHGIGNPFASILEPSLIVGQTMAYAVLLLISTMLLAGGTYNPFIYYRF
jgi:alginate O-acetyltransferase complex protein AlgI